MIFELARYLIVLAGTLISTYTDIKTGLILDKVTYPMILAGLLFTAADIFTGWNFIQLLIPVGVFALGYLLYYAGKLGGGDVKIFTAMALLLPYYRNEPFVLNVLLIAALSSVMAISVYYLSKYFRKAKKGSRIKENRRELLKAFMLGIALLLYFLVLHQLGFLALWHVLLLFIPLLFALLFLAFQKGIKESFFLKRIPISKLEEDEIIAREFLSKDILAGSGLSLKGIITKEDAKKLKDAGLKKVPVYRGMPPFAPFLLLGVIISFYWPSLFSELFLPF